jgi:beta-glucosidase
LSSDKIRTGEVLAIRAPVTNTGARPADETVQLYIRDRTASIVRPVRELKDFRRIRLEPGETEVVEFALPTASLTYFDADERPTEPLGEIEVYVGGSSLADRVAKFEIVERRADREQ